MVLEYNEHLVTSVSHQSSQTSSGDCVSQCPRSAGGSCTDGSQGLCCVIFLTRPSSCLVWRVPFSVWPLGSWASYFLMSDSTLTMLSFSSVTCSVVSSVCCTFRQVFKTTKKLCVEYSWPLVQAGPCSHSHEAKGVLQQTHVAVLIVFF